MDQRIIQKKLEIIRGRAVRARWPINRWECRTADHVAPGEYRYDGDWEAIDGKGTWPAGKTVFARARTDVPHGTSIDSLYVVFDIERLEGQLTVDGRPYAGVDDNHRRVKVPHGGALLLETEFFSVPSVLFQPELRSERGRLREARFEQVDGDIESAWHDLSFAWDAGRATCDERRKRLILDAIEEALLAIDLTTSDGRFREQVGMAREILSRRIGDIAPDPEGGRIFMTGHSHIDTAWLWPLRETVRKCGRTFSTACRMMETYPEYHFTCSQPQLYAFTRKHYPRLYDEIKDWVKQGRWETTGGMWVETDCNVPSGESLIRQILHGLKFFREEFGTRPRTCWLPDVFGYPASLPGVLRGCGLDYFYTNKLHWQARNKFPHHLFRWEGVDGSVLLAHIPLLTSYYCGDASPGDLVRSWDNFNEKAVHEEMMYPFGHGDGGGGPTERHLEYAKRAKSFPGVPACRQGIEEEYFRAVDKAGPELPRWRGELYLETHRGTYTSQAAAKRANRKNELLLREAEIAGVLAGRCGIDVDITPLRQAWENLLLLQFHDILPGSSIGEVYTEAARDYASIEEAARRVRDTALDGIANRAPGADLFVFNSLSWPRSDVTLATVPAPSGPVELVDHDGNAAAVQVTEQRGDKALIAFAPTDVPPMGYATFNLRAKKSKSETGLKIETGRIENRFFVIELNDVGEITRLWDKRREREILPQGKTANQLQLFQDGPENEAAWNVHATFEKCRYDFEGDTTVEIAETGPVRGAVKVTRNHRTSRIEQLITIYDAVPRIDFITCVDWLARQVMLKAAFPVEVRADRATYEIQFGVVQRATHNNTSWEQEQFEVPAHRWADLSEAGYGVSLLNDCKYGYDVKNNVLRLTLLRGSEWPDPEADKGRHQFTYSLLPHPGDWREGRTVHSASELNSPMTCLSSTAGDGSLQESNSFFDIDGPAIVETIKPAEDGRGIILRVYEPHGGRGKVTVTCTTDLRKVSACSHVEEDEADVPFEGKSFSFPIRPFQIRSFRLTFI